VLTAEVQGRVLIGGLPIRARRWSCTANRAGCRRYDRCDGFYRLTTQLPDGIPPGDGWLVVLAKMVLPKFVSLEQSGHA